MGNRFRITILCDNTVGSFSGALGEHGFAAIVEGEGKKIIFDTGQGGTLLNNSLRMNRDLRNLTGVVLSHGHYDHTGGILPLLRCSGPNEVFAHPGIFSRRYKVRDTGESHSIGIPYDEAFLRGSGGMFRFSESFREIADGIFLTGEIPRITGFETGDAGLFCDESGCNPDQVIDDQAMAIRGEKGMVVVLGCCHAGIINTLSLITQRTGCGEFYAVIGGTHLGYASPERLDSTLRELRRYNVRRFCACHCTGFPAAVRLAKDLPGRFQHVQVGYSLEF